MTHLFERATKLMKDDPLKYEWWILAVNPKKKTVRQVVNYGYSSREGAMYIIECWGTGAFNEGEECYRLERRLKK